MKNRDAAVSTLFLFLSNKDKLSLRQTNKINEQQTITHQDGPYKSKAEFIIGIGSIFNDTDHLNKAWEIYHSTTTSASVKPAILYKMVDMLNFKVDGTITKFAEGEDIYNAGRVYCPAQLHAWDVNQTWLLAQIHIARPFAIYSELSEYHFMRRGKPGVFSAFAKEISTTIKAGYTVTSINDNIIQLCPGDTKNMKQLTRADLDLCNTEIVAATEKVKCTKTKHKDAIALAEKLKKLFYSVESFTLGELKNFKLNDIGCISNNIHNLFVNCDNKSLLLRTFIENFNKGCISSAPTLACATSNSIWFDAKQIDLIASRITQSMTTHVDQLIQEKSRLKRRNTCNV